MVAYPTLLTTSPAWITLNISGVPHPTIRDTIGVFSPGVIEIRKTAPVRLLFGYKFGEDYLKTGNFSVRLFINNLRADVIFGLFLNNTRTWNSNNRKLLSAQSNVITFQNLNVPTQIHIANTGRPGQMKVMWTSGRVPSDRQTLMMGVKPKQYTKTVVPSYINHTASDMCAAPAINWGWRDPGSLWVALATDLVPGTVYYYTVGSKLTGWSQESHFTAPRDPSQMKSTRFAIVGDMGVGSPDGSADRRGMGGNVNSTYTDQIPRLVTIAMTKIIDTLDMVFIIGDVSYAQGYASTWEAYKEQMRPVAQRVPFLTVTGNHEADWPNIPDLVSTGDSTGECNGAYEKRYGMHMPKDDSSNAKLQWWAYDQGPVHVIAISTEHNYATGSAQYKWLVADLKKVNRTRTPWIVVGAHRPMYNHQCLDYNLVKFIEPLLVQFKVDVMYVGHLHSYQRGCPMVGYKCVDVGPTHVLVGSGNAGFHPYSRKRGMIHGGSTLPGFVTITANQTHFVNEFVATDHTIQDSFTLKIGYNKNLVYDKSIQPPAGVGQC